MAVPTSLGLVFWTSSCVPQGGAGPCRQLHPPSLLWEPMIPDQIQALVMRSHEAAAPVPTPQQLLLAPGSCDGPQETNPNT